MCAEAERSDCWRAPGAPRHCASYIDHAQPRHALTLLDPWQQRRHTANRANLAEMSRISWLACLSVLSCVACGKHTKPEGEGSGDATSWSYAGFVYAPRNQLAVVTGTSGVALVDPNGTVMTSIKLDVDHFVELFRIWKGQK